MKMNQIISTIRSLALSQGFYGRLLNNIEYLRDTDEDAYNNLVDELEAQNFHDEVDMVLYFEC